MGRTSDVASVVDHLKPQLLMGGVSFYLPLAPHHVHPESQQLGPFVTLAPKTASLGEALLVAVTAHPVLLSVVSTASSCPFQRRSSEKRHQWDRHLPHCPNSSSAGFSTGLSGLANGMT